MDFELSVDQGALQSAALSLLDDQCPTTRVRQVADETGHLDDTLWAAMAEQGWLAVELPEADGGLGLGLVETAVLCEQLGRHVAPVPFLGTVLTALALTWAVADEEAEATAALGEVGVGTWIEQLSAGDAVGAVSWSRRPGAVTAQSDGRRRWTLSGRSDLVVYGPSADVVIVFAEADGSPALFALAPEGAERPSAEPAMDRTRSVGWLDFADRPALRLGGPDRAADLLDRAATAMSAEMLGAADRVLEMTVAYAKDRVQFGRPIGGFQAVKHRSP
ncbi:MAG TPA: acyl-CoA dehydrogenase family protein, partial [Acidimicrobiales bacterium]|nr:acyl-CoA dehydrogenase family protein [Acidimicrobiales bacterium]